MTKDIDFEVLMRTLLRRISLVIHVCSGKPWDFDYATILKLAESVKRTQSSISWYDWKRFSNRQKDTMKLGGFLGTLTFEGELSPFMPYLRIGEWIHIGKACTFGLGKYWMEIRKA